MGLDHAGGQVGRGAARAMTAVTFAVDPVDASFAPRKRAGQGAGTP